MSILAHISTKAKRSEACVAQLIDPDHITNFDQLVDIIQTAETCGLDFFLFGGSLITRPASFDVLKAIKQITKIPVIIFPSSVSQLNAEADAILFLSLISGRNPEYLIGQQVAAAPILKQMPIEVLPTGYLLISCGKPTTAEYVSQTMAIPREKAEIAAVTALAGEMLGMKLIDQSIIFQGTINWF